MAKSRRHRRRKSFWQRHRIIRFFVIGATAITIVIVGLILISNITNAVRQARLATFYNTDKIPTNGQLGQVVRHEQLGAKVNYGHAERILYRTQTGDGRITFSSGMVFIPTGTATKPRPIVAWAHGTLGLGDSCAPTRTANPLNNMAWVNQMLQKGWIVTATDYAGFGTAGVQGYLVGGDEAHDVLNSVRAVRNLVGSSAGNTFVIWGHSQGGNSALFSAQAAANYAPELNLAGTVASAPAAELAPLLNEQYNTPADWIIGPLITTSWPSTNAKLTPGQVLTSLGQASYQKLANQCIVPATFEGLIRSALGQKFFTRNPIDVPAWRAMAQAQSAPILQPSQPLLVVESKTDQVVLPNTTALYIQMACTAHSTLSSYWLDGVPHQEIPTKSASTVMSWISDRFYARSVSSDCNQKLPVTPYQAL